jgi:membrane-bound serine protease (ClpP class)
MMKRQMKRHAWLVYIAATGLTATWGPAAGEDAGNATDPDEPTPQASEFVGAPEDPPSSIPTGANVAVIRIDGMIYGFTLESLQRRVERALDRGATFIVIELDTPGGIVTDALKISKYIKTLSVPTLAWINNEAYSAGIMIASACDQIVMSKSSATGDCAPIRMGSDLAPTERAKALSPILEEFRDSATDNGYDYAMFHAMCVLGVEVNLVEHVETGQRRLVNQADYQVMVKGLERDLANEQVEPDAPPPQTIVVEEKSVKVQAPQETGKVSVEVATDDDRGKWKLIKQVHDGQTLLTVNQTRALEIGLSRKTISRKSELQTWLGAGQVRYIEQSWSEGLVAWLVHPAVRGVLIVALLMGAYMEFQSPGLGLPGAVALTALVVLLGSPFLVGLADFWHVLLFFVGFILLMIEVFVTPGFAVLGALGLLMMFAGLVIGVVPLPGGNFNVPNRVILQQLQTSALFALLGATLGCTGVLLLLHYFGSIPYLRKLVLDSAQTTQTAGAHDAAVAVSGSEVLGSGAVTVGATGTVISELRPTGRAQIAGQAVDVVSLGQWIGVSSGVRVVEVHGNRIVVEPQDA